VTSSRRATEQGGRRDVTWSGNVAVPALIMEIKLNPVDSLVQSWTPTSTFQVLPTHSDS